MNIYTTAKRALSSVCMRLKSLLFLMFNLLFFLKSCVGEIFCQREERFGNLIFSEQIYQILEGKQILLVCIECKTWYLGGEAVIRSIDRDNIKWIFQISYITSMVIYLFLSSLSEIFFFEFLDQRLEVVFRKTKYASLSSLIVVFNVTQFQDTITKSNFRNLSAIVTLSSLQKKLM